MTAKEAYEHYTQLTDPNDIRVTEDIKRGIRMPGGLTDVHDHLPRLLNLAHGDVLEIGVRFGVSTAALLYGVHRQIGHVWSIDIADCSNLYNDPNWTFIQADSKDTAKVKPLIPKGFQLLFIDGDHSFEGVLADLQNYGPMAYMVALHDSNPNGHPGVSLAIKEYFNNPNCRQTIMRFFTDSHGLAVLS